MMMLTLAIDISNTWTMMTWCWCWRRLRKLQQQVSESVACDVTWRRLSDVIDTSSWRRRDVIAESSSSVVCFSSQRIRLGAVWTQSDGWWVDEVWTRHDGVTWPSETRHRAEFVDVDEAAQSAGSVYDAITRRWRHRPHQTSVHQSRLYRYE